MKGTYRFTPAGADRAAVIVASLIRDGIPYETIIDGDVTTIRAEGTPKHRRSSTPPVKRTSPSPLTVEQCRKRLAEARKILAAFDLREHFKLRYSEGYWPRPRHLERKAIGQALARIIARANQCQHAKHRRQCAECKAMDYTLHKDCCQPCKKAAQPGKRRPPCANWKKRDVRQLDRNPRDISKEEYKLMDAACGHKVRRARALPTGYYSWTEYICRREAGGAWERGARKTEELWEAVSPVETFLKLKLDVEYWTEMVRLTDGSYMQ